MDKTKIRICVFGLYAQEEPRNQLLLKGLEKNGAELIYCNYPAKDKRSEAKTFGVVGIFNMLRFYLVNYIKLILKYIKTPKHDIILVLFPGYLDIFLAELISLKPTIYVPHISLYNALVEDRKFISNPFLKWICYQLDKRSCRIADVIILDTNAHIDYFANTFHIPKTKFKRIFIGADNETFYPRASVTTPYFTILSYGKYVPVQGLEKIIEAMRLLPQDIKLIMVGKGQTRQSIQESAKDIPNIEFIDWIDHEKMPDKINEADICIGGQFGISQRANQIISIKAFEMIAMGKPILIVNSEAMNELFTHNKNSYMCEPTAKSIADGILALRSNRELRATLGKNAHDLFTSRCTPKIIGKELLTIAEGLLC